MAHWLAYRLAAFGVPHARGLVVRGGDNPPPVWTETGRSDRALMAHWLAHRLAAFGVPHARGLVVEAVTIRRPSGLKLAALTASSWRIGSPTGLPLSASHTRAVLSLRGGDNPPPVWTETGRID